MKAIDGVMAAAFGVSVVGFLVLLVGEVASLTSPWVLVAGVGLLALGIVLAFVFGYLASRQDGVGFFRSLWRGFVTLLSWAWTLLS